MQKKSLPRVEVHCRGCGNPVAHDHAGDLLCSACRLSRRDYYPRHDAAFNDRLLALFDEAGERLVRPLDELGISLAYRRDLWREVRILRRRIALRRLDRRLRAHRRLSAATQV